MEKITFRQWLELQCERRDLVGFLARDVLSDTCSKGKHSVRAIRRHILRDHTPCNNAIKALELAIGEYYAFCYKGGQHNLV